MIGARSRFSRTPSAIHCISRLISGSISLIGIHHLCYDDIDFTHDGTWVYAKTARSIAFRDVDGAEMAEIADKVVGVIMTDLVPGTLRAEEALALVGLSERLDHFPAQLSGGEQQRVAIARAIVKRPQVLLCDEPTGALDYATGKQVLEVIETINRELGTTTVVITHNAAIAGMADRVIHLAGGRIQREERPERKLRPSELSW